MYINKNLVDSVSLERRKIIYPGYIAGFTRLLKDKHTALISRTIHEPEFIVRNKLEGPQTSNG
jgi:hypothetical protein